MSANSASAKEIAQPPWKGVQGTEFKYAIRLYCEDNSYGPNCSCQETGNIVCDKTTGAKSCKDDWYGDQCDKYCKNSTTTTCTSDGKTICADDYFGPNCTCKQTGNFVCDDSGKRRCKDDYFGKDCQTYCKPLSTDNYVCNTTDGSKICINKYEGPNCNCLPPPGNWECGSDGKPKCKDGFYGKGCKIECREPVGAHFYCNEIDGKKICYDSYYPPNDCSIQCVPQDDDKAGHYTCDSATGGKVCTPGWKGTKCTNKVYFGKYIIEMNLIEFTNPKKQLNNTGCCDSYIPGVCRDCDPTFIGCVSDKAEIKDDSDCNIGKFQTKNYADTNDVKFTRFLRSDPHLQNPILLSTNETWKVILY